MKKSIIHSYNDPYICNSCNDGSCSTKDLSIPIGHANKPTDIGYIEVAEWCCHEYSNQDETDEVTNCLTHDTHNWIDDLIQSTVHFSFHPHTLPYRE